MLCVVKRYVALYAVSGLSILIPNISWIDAHTYSTYMDTVGLGKISLCGRSVNIETCVVFLRVPDDSDSVILFYNNQYVNS